MNRHLFEFQFRWGPAEQCFGVDVQAPTITAALAKANNFFNSPGNAFPESRRDVKRVCVYVAAVVTEADIIQVYDLDGVAGYLTLQQFKAQFPKRK